MLQVVPQPPTWWQKGWFWDPLGFWAQPAHPALGTILWKPFLDGLEFLCWLLMAKKELLMAIKGLLMALKGLLMAIKGLLMAIKGLLVAINGHTWLLAAVTGH